MLKSTHEAFLILISASSILQLWSTSDSTFLDFFHNSFFKIILNFKCESLFILSFIPDITRTTDNVFFCTGGDTLLFRFSLNRISCGFDERSCRISHTIIEVYLSSFDID